MTQLPVASACGLAVSGSTVNHVISSRMKLPEELCRLGVACFGAKHKGVLAVLSALFPEATVLGACIESPKAVVL